MSNFKSAVEKTVWMLIDKYNTCIQPHYNALGDVQIVFLEGGCGGQPNMHQYMKELHENLTDILGYPPCMSHNHPTDNVVQVLADPICGERYYSDECCKKVTIEACIRFLNTDKQGYSDEIRSIAFAAEVLSENLDKPVLSILQSLDWNKDVQAQLIAQLINYHR